MVIKGTCHNYGGIGHAYIWIDFLIANRLLVSSCIGRWRFRRWNHRVEDGVARQILSFSPWFFGFCEWAVRSILRVVTCNLVEKSDFTSSCSDSIFMCQLFGAYALFIKIDFAVPAASAAIWKWPKVLGPWRLNYSLYIWGPYLYNPW